MTLSNHHTEEQYLALEAALQQARTEIAGLTVERQQAYEDGLVDGDKNAQATIERLAAQSASLRAQVERVDLAAAYMQRAVDRYDEHGGTIAEYEPIRVSISMLRGVAHSSDVAIARAALHEGSPE